MRMFKIKELTFQTTKPFDSIDITDKVVQFLKDIKSQEGLVNVFTRHTTAVLKLNKSEHWLWETILTGVSSETIPVNDGKMLLWVSQRIMLIEMDQAGSRTLVFSFTWATNDSGRPALIE